MEQDCNVNLKWDAHQTTLKSVFDNLLDTESLADCTVGAEGQHLKAHKIMLSACSRYFEVLFSQHYGQHTVILLPGVQFHILKALVEFMYRGEVLVPQDEIDALLQLANFLQVKGLSYGDNTVSEKKQDYRRRNTSATYSECTPSHEHTPSQCHVSPESYKQCTSPELLEVSGSSSQSECLQKQNYTKVTPISTPVRMRKKSNWNSSREEPPAHQDLVPPSHTASHDFPLRRSELSDKSNSARSMFPDTVASPSLTSQLPVLSEGNFSELMLSKKELTSAKPSNSVTRTPLCPTVSEDNSILEAFAEPKQENCDSNENCGDDVILDSDDTQHQNISDDVSGVTESSFCDEDSFPQQMWFQQMERTDKAPTEHTPASNNRFKCQSCNRSYRHHRDLVRHLKYECGKEPQFQCPHCLVRFTHKHTLKVHMVRHQY
ncbi:longitudinals lacking protein, isoforms N/O/W/X/Y-like isoform X2 [Schistocerca cancellata]|uniref:longitudinals lacking protein, isoforms N/O/W/X/Y-like isoform X2 n=1 Tax=Schistocerca cancellata TaxID=274614 RepID=UPI0021175954|nr:longitudinals lacking protein, isoforms N/O/W/X/Y-like isoform X2 [Schistocerca cancellata]